MDSACTGTRHEETKGDGEMKSKHRGRTREREREKKQNIRRERQRERESQHASTTAFPMSRIPSTESRREREREAKVQDFPNSVPASTPNNTALSNIQNPLGTVTQKAEVT